MSSCKALLAHKFDPALNVAKLYNAVMKDNKDLCATITELDFHPVIEHLRQSENREVLWLEYLVTVVSPNCEVNVPNATLLLRLLLGAQVLDPCVAEEQRTR